MPRPRMGTGDRVIVVETGQVGTILYVRADAGGGDRFVVKMDDPALGRSERAFGPEDLAYEHPGGSGGSGRVVESDHNRVRKLLQDSFVTAVEHVCEPGRDVLVLHLAKGGRLATVEIETRTVLPGFLDLRVTHETTLAATTGGTQTSGEGIGRGGN